MPSCAYLSAGFMRIIAPQNGASAVRRGTAGVQAACRAGIVRTVYDDDDYRVTSEPYRLVPPRKRAGNEDLGGAVDGATGTAPVPDAGTGSSGQIRLRRAARCAPGRRVDPCRGDSHRGYHMPGMGEASLAIQAGRVRIGQH